MSVDQLRSGFYRLSRELYSDTFTRHRRHQFQQHYRRQWLAARSA